MTDDSLTGEEARGFAVAFSADRTARVVQNVVAETPIDKVAMDQEIVTSIDPSVFVKADTWPITNQKKSGRCWLFPGLNSLKSVVYEHTGVEEFEFSQNYQHFWDKLEKAGCFLTSMIKFADRDVDDRTIRYLLSNPIDDGGQWNIFVTLVEKYEVVPKYAMPETESLSNTRAMNQALQKLLHRGTRDIRRAFSGEADPRAVKAAVLEQVYRVLATYLGTPPQYFVWQWRNRDGEFGREGEMTPLEFAVRYLPDFGEYMCLVNDPRPTSPYNALFTVDRFDDVVGAKPVVYLSVPIEMICRATLETLESGKLVWMECDTAKQCDSKLGVWDGRLFDYEGAYGIDLEMTKAEELQYGEAQMTHAMVFTGVDILDGKIRRWRIENFWGDEIANRSFFTMNDSWFDQHVFEVAVHRGRLSANLLLALGSEPIVLPAWDPMGSLAWGEAFADAKDVDARETADCEGGSAHDFRRRRAVCGRLAVFGVHHYPSS